MMSSNPLMAFVPALQIDRSRAFFENVLGLRVTGEDPYGVWFDANGIRLRLVAPPDFKPAQFTIVGWAVGDIVAAVTKLRERGVRFEMYGMEGQDESGIWTTPNGDKVAWFKDPAGNVLSLTQFQV